MRYNIKEEKSEEILDGGAVTPSADGKTYISQKW